jgi:hypothetical protein
MVPRRVSATESINYSTYCTVYIINIYVLTHQYYLEPEIYTVPPIKALSQPFACRIGDL